MPTSVAVETSSRGQSTEPSGAGASTLIEPLGAVPWRSGQSVNPILGSPSWGARTLGNVVSGTPTDTDGGVMGK